MINIKLIQKYIAKRFTISFVQITLAFALLIFFINLMEALDKVKYSEAPFYAAIYMAFLNIPDFLNDITPSLIIISAIATFVNLSIKSEITIMRISGFSLWHILQPIMITAFLIGIFWVVIFGSLSAAMTKQFNHIEGKYIKKEIREVVEPKNGIWIRQENINQKGEEIIIQAKKVYNKNLELDNATLWFFNKDNEFYKKINAKKMTLHKGFWEIDDLILNDFKQLNLRLEKLTLPTNLEQEFVHQRIVNDFQNVKLFTIFQLPPLINKLKKSGFNANKFIVHLHSLISKPFLFMAITLIACFFGLNHIRNQNVAIMTFFGIIVGLVFYIISSILIAFGSSGLIPIFASTWLIVLICFAIGTLLIYQKENL